VTGVVELPPEIGAPEMGVVELPPETGAVVFPASGVPATARAAHVAKSALVALDCDEC
jgi:hypothetical protein